MIKSSFVLKSIKREFLLIQDDTNNNFQKRITTHPYDMRVGLLLKIEQSN